MIYVCEYCGETDRVKRKYNPIIGYVIICDDCGCEVRREKNEKETT